MDRVGMVTRRINMVRITGWYLQFTYKYTLYFATISYRQPTTRTRAESTTQSFFHVNRRTHPTPKTLTVCFSEKKQTVRPTKCHLCPRNSRPYFFRESLLKKALFTGCATPFQYFSVKVRILPDSKKKNPAGLTNASHGKRVVQQNPKTDSVLQYLGIPHYPNTIQYLAGTFSDLASFLHRNLHRNLQESPGFFWGFGSELLVIWYSIHLGPPVMAPAGGQLEGLGIWKEVSDLGMMIIVCYLSIWCAYIYIYMCVYEMYAYTDLAFFFEYIVVQCGTYNI